MKLYHRRTLEGDLPKQKGMGGMMDGLMGGLMGGAMSGGSSIDAQFLMTVTIRQADGLPVSAKGSLPDPFVVVECDGKTAKTPVVFNSTNPVFNETAIFYRNSLSAPVKLQVLDKIHKLISNIFLDTN